MRIVFAIPGMGYGGAERVVSVLANELINSNKVKIILTSGDGRKAYFLNKNIEVDTISSNYTVHKRWCTFRKLCKEFKADVVIAFMDTVGIMASCYLAFSKIPVIISERNDPSEKSRELSRGFKILRKISYYLAAGYVFQSNGAKEYYPIRCQNKSTVILNPIDVSSLPDRTDDRIEKKIVTVGRLHPQKNHKLLIKSFAKSNFCKYGYTLHIYGEGELRKELESLIYKLNIQDKVFLEGNHADVLNEIKNASLFVFTSNYEGLPNALMEAMALGIPVISTDCSPGGARMLIKDDESNGIIIPCNEEKKLIESLDYWFSHPHIMENAGLQARQIRDKINVQSVTLLWIEFIKKVISGVK